MDAPILGTVDLSFRQAGVVLATLVALVVTYPVSPEGLARDGWYAAVGSASILWAFLGLRKHRPLRPKPWLRVLAGFGGESGWGGYDVLWNLRARADRVIGGPGLRGRPDGEPRPGDPVHFWRVEDVVPGERLRLRAEMRREWKERSAAGREMYERKRGGGGGHRKTY